MFSLPMIESLLCQILCLVLTFSFLIISGAFLHDILKTIAGYFEKERTSYLFLWKAYMLCFSKPFTEEVGLSFAA